tara:strand:+ start:1134 stop:1367 length:234 start_codon:yes stop_codon:yes gene_type:complete
LDFGFKIEDSERCVILNLSLKLRYAISDLVFQFKMLILEVDCLHQGSPDAERSIREFKFYKALGKWFCESMILISNS